jgi:hypothetical protein
MAVLKSHKLLCTLICCFLVVAGCSAVNMKKDSNVLIDNQIEECFQIKAINKLVHNNVILLDTELSPIKSIGYCGCKSTILSYYVVSNSIESNDQAREYSIFSSLSHEKYTFVINRNDNSDKNQSYTVNIQCASPN